MRCSALAHGTICSTWVGLRIVSHTRIEENPNIGTDTLADFGTAQFGPVFTHSTSDQAVVESGSSVNVGNNSGFNPNRVPLPPTYYIGQLANYKINMVNDGTLLASTSGLTGTDQCSFTVQWENS